MKLPFLLKEKTKKNEFIPTNNNAMLSYRDVLVNGRNKHDRTVQELLYMAMEAISLLPRQVEYDLDNENYDDLPDTPHGEVLSEDQQDELMWETFRKAYEG